MTPPNFEDALAELDRILRALEDGSTSLDEALARYERGVGLLKACYGQLRAAELRIQRLEPGDAGPPELSPFEHTAAVEKAAPKRRAPGTNGARPRGDSEEGTIPF